MANTLTTVANFFSWYFDENVNNMSVKNLTNNIIDNDFLEDDNLKSQFDPGDGDIDKIARELAKVILKHKKDNVKVTSTKSHYDYETKMSFDDDNYGKVIFMLPTMNQFNK